MDKSDVYRDIERLQREQQRTIAELLKNPDDEAARQRYRVTNAHVRALRMRVSEPREVRA